MREDRSARAKAVVRSFYDAGARGELPSFAASLDFRRLSYES